MTHHKRKHTSESRRPLGGTATAFKQSAVPVKDITPAKLLGDPGLTVQLSEQELNDARKKVQAARDSARSTS
jgi:hypothetical protein